MFDASRGFGFLAPDEGGADIFFHVTALRGVPKIEKGRRVTFDLMVDERTGRTKAAFVATMEG